MFISRTYEGGNIKQNKITTNNREVYEKLNMLRFMPEVTIKNDGKMKLGKIINNINSKEDVISREDFGNYIVLKRKKPIRYNVYFGK